MPRVQNKVVFTLPKRFPLPSFKYSNRHLTFLISYTRLFRMMQEFPNAFDAGGKKIIYKNFL
jgi:hypothetical protein